MDEDDEALPVERAGKWGVGAEGKPEVAPGRIGVLATLVEGVRGSDNDNGAGSLNSFVSLDSIECDGVVELEKRVDPLSSKTLSLFSLIALSLLGMRGLLLSRPPSV